MTTNPWIFSSDVLHQNTKPFYQAMLQTTSYQTTMQGIGLNYRTKFIPFFASVGQPSYDPRILGPESQKPIMSQTSSYQPNMHASHMTRSHTSQQGNNHGTGSRRKVSQRVLDAAKNFENFSH